MIHRLREYDEPELGQIVAEKRRWETIVRDLSDVVVATDQEQNVIGFNRWAERLTGISARLALGRDAGCAFPG